MQAYVLVLGVGIGLQLLGFARVYTLMARRAKPSAQGPLSSREHGYIARISYLVSVACRNHLFEAECLHRSLVQYELLRRRGIGVDLCIGVRKEGGGLAAHAWLEYEGVVLREPSQVQDVYSLLLRSVGEGIAGSTDSTV